MSYRNACRFMRYRGEWFAVQVNAPLESLVDREPAPMEEDAVVVPNEMAAAAPDLYDALEHTLSSRGAGWSQEQRYQVEQHAHKVLAKARGEGA